MNRLCQSSYGNLEAVINVSGFRGDNRRKLIHFSRDRKTGQWNTSAIISENPISGGSIIENLVKRHPDQIHGEFEVLVLESDGILKHYTRDNLVSQDDGVFVWRLSASVNVIEESKASPGVTPSYLTVTRDASPLLQMPSNGGVSLETTVLALGGDLIHYRCLLNTVGKNLLADRYQWKKADVITSDAMGPACLYKLESKPLTALVPVRNAINAYCLQGGKWTMSRTVLDSHGMVCTSYVPVPGIATMEVVFKTAGSVLRSFTMDGTTSKPTETLLPPALSHIRSSPCHRVRPSSPIAIASQMKHGLGHSPNTEAVVFHACGTGWQDTWMILHWSLLSGTDEWVVSGVVLPHVTGMPL
ncbi:hypothetical protein GGS20DRAFT_350072 [Poronia punctata]|nr:hypothetical protein GGS20DRAFT_350072 [Poronia punctata]